MNKGMITTLLACALAAWLAGCKKSETEAPAKSANAPAATPKATPDAHVHPDGSTHEAHDDAADHGHEHDEVSLGTADVGDLKVEFAQSHGKVEAGKEGHLIVKLPYNDKGATIVRAWIGTEDRLKSVVGKGDYAPSHNDYDIHAVAPDPLPANTMWWVDIQKPDGTKLVGSVKPLLD